MMQGGSIMKRILRLTGSLLGVLVLAGLVMALVMTFQGLRGEPQAESPMFQSPIETPTPSRPQKTPTKHPVTTPTTTPQPTRVYPPPTVVMPTLIVPTPPTPIPNAPLISEERAIAIALSSNPRFIEMRQSGKLKVTTKLTVHGDTKAGTTGVAIFHPHLPVWMIYLHLPEWKEVRGPAGQEVTVKFNTERFEIDAVTGVVIGGGRSYMNEDDIATVIPETLP